MSTPPKRLLLVGGYAVPLDDEMLGPPPAAAQGLLSVRAAKGENAATMTLLIPARGSSISPHTSAASRASRRQSRHQAGIERERAGAEPEGARSVSRQRGWPPPLPRRRLQGAPWRAGRHFELDPERIVRGAGSDELFGLLARAYTGPGDETYTPGTAS